MIKFLTFLAVLMFFVVIMVVFVTGIYVSVTGFKYEDNKPTKIALILISFCMVICSAWSFASLYIIFN